MGCVSENGARLRAWAGASAEDGMTHGDAFGAARSRFGAVAGGAGRAGRRMADSIAMKPIPAANPSGRRGIEWRPMVDGSGISPSVAANGPVEAAPGASVEAEGSARPNGPRDERAARARIAGELYEAHFHRVYAFVRRSLDDAEAEEIAHEAFVRLLKVRDLERMTISVAYLLRIAENLLKRRFERSQRYRAILERMGRGAPGLLGDSEDAPGAIVVRRTEEEPAGKADSQRLQSALGCLTSGEQSAIRLIVCEGLEYDAAARSLGVPVSTINNWKHRGIAKLRQLIESRATSDPDLRGREAC